MQLRGAQLPPVCEHAQGQRRQRFHARAALPPQALPRRRCTHGCVKQMSE